MFQLGIQSSVWLTDWLEQSSGHCSEISWQAHWREVSLTAALSFPILELNPIVGNTASYREILPSEELVTGERERDIPAWDDETEKNRCEMNKDLLFHPSLTPSPSLSRPLSKLPIPVSLGKHNFRWAVCSVCWTPVQSADARRSPTQYAAYWVCVDDTLLVTLWYWVSVCWRASEVRACSP